MDEFAPELELDDLTHRYTLGGIEIPGCTAVLKAMGVTPNFSFMPPQELEYYSDRGTQTAKTLEMAIRGTLDRRSVVKDKEIGPRLIGWERFQNDYQAEVVMLNGEPFVEKILCHPVYRYGVRPDVVIKIKNETGPLEWKATSAHSVATGIQLASQLIAIRHVMPSVGKLRMGLRLFAKEPYYDVRRYQEASDEAVWQSCLNLFNWKRKHKLL